jgi:hypothetical protein
MSNEYKNLTEEEKIKAENDFLKMKIMLEHNGQYFSGTTDEEIPAEIENQFLTNIVEFEKEYASGKTISVFEKIGSPDHFKPISEISDRDIEQAWDTLSAYMSEHGVELSACSPNVSARELYRFTIEELFKHETDDINVPGMTTCFIYDEFYPDHVYDNTRAAVDDCIRAIFCKEPFEWMHHFAEQIRLNNHLSLSRDDFKNIINRFKDVHDEIELDTLDVESAKIEDKLCPVKGNYAAHARIDTTTIEYKGNWLVEFVSKDDWGYWYITNVQMGGLIL